MYTHYKLDNGKIWSIADACFVQSVPEGAETASPIGEDGRTADEAGLYFCLKTFGYPLGDLKTDADYSAEAREKRNALIAETDYLVMPDYPLDDNKKAAILSYRQELRDITKQSGFPRQVIWPEKP